MVDLFLTNLTKTVLRSQQLSLNEYDSDKITNGYLRWYDPVFEPWVNKTITLLELGIYRGGSLLLWRDYFPYATVVGIDLNLPKNFMAGDRIHLFEGSQTDLQFLSRAANEIAPGGFDIIIDDASHIGELTKTAFWHLFDNHLKPNGLYAIEDWGTGYLDDWPDGKRLNLETYLGPKPRDGLSWLNRLKRMWTKEILRSHSHGMVGFIKQLIDEQGAGNVTKGKLEGKSKRGSKFEKMLVTPDIVFISKAG
ncbi:MAG TPA: class I SAM-dependent methyltransferase [Thermodesulfobacteriota bacterium]|nr:class I SAM-dependent methyltransferase [Thermodesulfobacteriota bacterium]